MKKGSKKPQQKIVKYLGETWKLQPGHGVFSVNTNDPVGTVKESKLERYYPLNPFYWLFYWKNGPYFQPKDRRTFVIHISAYNRERALTRFKNMFSDIKVNGKKYMVK
jgi:hypothetical protein